MNKVLLSHRHSCFDITNNQLRPLKQIIARSAWLADQNYKCQQHVTFKVWLRSLGFKMETSHPESEVSRRNQFKNVRFSLPLQSLDISYFYMCRKPGFCIIQENAVGNAIYLLMKRSCKTRTWHTEWLRRTNSYFSSLNSRSW